MTFGARATPIRSDADAAATAELREIDGRRVVWFRIAGGKHHGAIGTRGGATVERAVELAGELGVPLVGELDTSGAELGEGVAALHAWGRLARELVAVSGNVPTVLAVTGACVSGPALALGCFDQVVMTSDAFAFVTGPDSISDFTGESVSRARARRERDARPAQRRCRARGAKTRRWPARRSPRSCRISPTTTSPILPRCDSGDDRNRLSTTAAATIPASPSASYDVRDVIDDVVDTGSRLELRAALRAQSGDRAGDARRAADRRGREPARAPRRDHRHRGVAQGRPFHRVVRQLQPADRDVRRHARVRARSRSRVARHDPPRRRAGARLRGGDRSAAVRGHAQGLRRRLHRHGLARPRQRPHGRVARARRSR